MLDIYAKTSPLPSNGLIGVAVNGVPFMTHSMTDLFDSCMGHVDQQHGYHYHLPPTCLISSLGGVANSTWMLDRSWPAAADPSPLVGWALDGWPIFGPYDEHGDLMVGSSQGALATLDECNGKVLESGGYAYFSTPTAPYNVNCFRSRVGSWTSRGSPVRSCPRQGLRSSYCPGPSEACPALSPPECPLCSERFFLFTTCPEPLWWMYGGYAYAAAWLGVPVLLLVGSVVLSRWHPLGSKGIGRALQETGYEMSWWDADTRGLEVETETQDARRSALADFSVVALGKLVIQAPRLGIATSLFGLAASRVSFGLIASPDTVDGAVPGALLAILYGLAYPALNHCFSLLFVLFMTRARSWSAYRRNVPRAVLTLSPVLQLLVQLAMDVLRSVVGLNPSEHAWLSACQVYFALLALGLSAGVVRCWLTLPRRALRRLRRELWALLAVACLMSLSAALALLRSALLQGVDLAWLSRLTADEARWLREAADAACGVALAAALGASVARRAADGAEHASAASADGLESEELPGDRSLDGEAELDGRGCQLSFRGTISWLGIIFVAIAGFGPWYVSHGRNTDSMADLAEKLRYHAVSSVRAEVLDMSGSVQQAVLRGALGPFSDEEPDFGCCSAGDADAQELDRFSKIRRYHWENLESNTRVLLSMSGTMAGSFIQLARTSNLDDIDGTNARDGRGNFQWTLSDATTNYTYQQYSSNVWTDQGYVEADTSMCGQGYIRTKLTVAIDLASKAECDAAAAAVGAASISAEIMDSARPRGCFRGADGSGVFWNPGGNASLEEEDTHALCSLPSWFPRNRTFRPDCDHPWPCTSGQFVATNDPEFNQTLFQYSEVPYNATASPWWKGAVLHGIPEHCRTVVGWSEIEMWESVGQLVKPAVLPLYVGGTDTVRAVITAGVGLLYLDDVLDGVVKENVDPTAKAWLVDASTGSLIASSPIGLSMGNSPNLTLATSAGELGEAGAHIQAVSTELLGRLGSWTALRSEHPEGYFFEYDSGGADLDLVQVTSIADGHGLEWIVLLSIPKPVFYESVEKAKLWTVIVTVALTVVMGVILFAISWVVSSHIRKLGVKMAKVSQMQWAASSVDGSMYREIVSMESSFCEMALKLKRFWDLEQEKARREEHDRTIRQATRIRAAITEKEELRHPMVLLRASTFIRLGRLMRYEDLRDTGKLHILDTMAEAEDFGKQYSIVFFSHQWLDWGLPDPENVHHRCMTNAIRQLQKTVKNPRGAGECSLDDMYVWVDYSSISQKHRGMQILAISALPVYSSISDAFVVIAPPAVHAASCMRCDLQSYDARGWCRVETLSKVCGSGLDKMFLMTGIDSVLEQVTIGTFKENLSLRVFEGSFSCCSLGHRGQAYCDKELLVESVLGLYHQLLTSSTPDQVVLEHIEESKERFFPARMSFHKDRAKSKINVDPRGSLSRRGGRRKGRAADADEGQGQDEDRELFGEMVALVEDIAHGEAVLGVDTGTAELTVDRSCAGLRRASCETSEGRRSSRSTDSVPAARSQ